MLAARSNEGSIPIKCTNPECGFEWQAVNMFKAENGNTIDVSGVTSSCPMCYSVAKYADFSVDDRGKLSIHTFAKDLKKFGDKSRLSKLKSTVDAANDDFTADDFVDALKEVSPEFEQYRSYFKSLSLGQFSAVFSTIIALISLYYCIITYDATQEGNSIMRQQLELSQKQFSYQIEKDKEEAREQLLLQDKKLEEIFNQLEDESKKLNSADDSNSSLPKVQTYKIQQANNKTTGVGLKGNMRNKPCSCGSGLKAKRCHPFGLA